MHPCNNIMPLAPTGSNTLNLLDALCFRLAQGLRNCLSPEMASVSHLHCTVNSSFPSYGHSIITDLSDQIIYPMKYSRVTDNSHLSPPPRHVIHCRVRKNLFCFPSHSQSLTSCLALMKQTTKRSFSQIFVKYGDWLSLAGK